MSWLYRTFVRPSLFAQDSEDIHNFTIGALGRISRNELLCDAMAAFLGAPELPVDLWSLRFPNPVGLAAGMDKEAAAVPAWAAMGFGFAELGAATWLGQPGNDRPRVFRAIPEEALVNRMGFNNPGAEVIAAALASWRQKGRWPNHPVGINLGKSKMTPLEKAVEDYVASLRVLWPWADFFVVNVSSPNTPNLRQLQDKAALGEILQGLQEVNRGLAKQSRSGLTSVARDTAPTGRLKPILVKVAPDLTWDALDDILELVQPHQVAGLVATNTTISRPQSGDPRCQRTYAQTGGLSGKPLRARSTEVVRHLHRQTRGTVPIIGVGGIFNADDAWEKITAGASLVQVYTGLVYEGPGIAKAIVTGLIEKLEEHGLSSLPAAVGMSNRS